MKETLYVVDGSTYLHAAFHAKPEHAARIASMFVDKLRRYRPVTHLAVALDAPPPTFRDGLWPDYKKVRRAKKTQEEREALARVQDEFIRTVEDGLEVRTFRSPGFEADDVVATLVAIAEEDGLDAVVVAKDKDFSQLVNANVRLWSGEDNDAPADEAAIEKKWKVRADQFVDYLAMVGDSTDGLPGIRNVGEVAAVDILREFGSMDACFDHAEKMKDPSARSSHVFWGKRGRVWSAMAGGRDAGNLMRKLVRLRRDALLDLDSIKELAVAF